MIGNSSNRNSFPYIYRGLVLDNQDPLNLGRCRIRIPSIHGDAQITPDMLPWARPIVVTPVGAGKGCSYIPSLHDIVWVLFEGGDKDSPVYLGGTYGETDLPDLNIDTILIYQDKEMRISWIPETAELSLVNGGSKISIKPESINISSDNNIDIESSGEIVLEAPVISMRGDTLNLEFSNIKGLSEEDS